jgi:hypothetical protein
MNSLLGVALGASMVVGSVLAFRYADVLAGGRTRRAAGDVAGSGGGGVGLRVALNRGVALATALLGVATVVLFLS